MGRVVSQTRVSPTPAAASAFLLSPAAHNTLTRISTAVPKQTIRDLNRSSESLYSRKVGGDIAKHARAQAHTARTHAPDPWWRGWLGAPRRKDGPSLLPRRGGRARGDQSSASHRRLGLASRSSPSPSPLPLTPPPPQPQLLLRFGAPPSFPPLVVFA